MKKEINCRLVDGKPKISFNEFKFDAPVKGEIIMGCLNKEKYFMWIEGDTGCYNQIHVKLHPLLPKEGLELKKGPIDERGEWEISPASPEEKHVMLYLLKKSGLELVNGEVRKKPWVPEAKESYWIIGIPGTCSFKEPQFSCKMYIDKEELPKGIFKCYKTGEACQKVVDQLNEIIIKSEQE